MSHGAEEDRIERAQLLNAVRGHHVSGLHVGFTAPIERVPLACESKTLPRSVEYPDALWNHFLPDAISRNHRNVEGSHARRVLPFLR